MTTDTKTKTVCPQSFNPGVKILNIVAAFRGMHVSPAKHSSGGVTDGQTDRQTTDKVIPMCRYASQATQKPILNCQHLIKAYEH